MGVIRVTDRQTGEEFALEEGSFDPERHQLVAGQTVLVDAAGGEGEAAALALTEDELARQSFERIGVDRELELVEEAVKEERHGGLTNALGQGVRGALSAFTLGGSELLVRPDTELEREEERENREVNQQYFAGGEFVGGLGSAFLPGSQLRFLRGLSRLSPAAQTSALAGHIAARGSQTAFSRIGRAALGGSIDGAATSVGNLVADEALRENPNFSAEALADAAGMGALLGGTIAGGFKGAAIGAREARERLAKRLADPGAESVTRPAQEAIGAATVPFADVTSKSMRTKAPARFGDLVGHVDDQSRRAITAVMEEIPDVTNRLATLGVEPGVRNQAKAALERAASRYADAATEAKRWTTDALEQMGVRDVASLDLDRVARELPEGLDERAALALARLDDAAMDFQAQLRPLENLVDRGEAELVASGATAESARGIGARVTGLLRDTVRGDGRLATALGAVEAARDIGLEVPGGLPTVSDIPVVGDALGLYVRYKAGTNGLRRIGVLPSTGQTRAASAVNRARDRITRAVGSVALSTTARTLARKAPSMIANEIRELDAQSYTQIAERAQIANADTPDLALAAAQTAVRARAYLVANAPKNPYRDAPFQVPWAPTADEAQLWQRRADAVADPLGAVEASMSEPYPDLEAEALREVYPEIYAAARADLLERAPEITAELPDHRLQALGRAYRVPLTINQLPNYPRPGTTIQPSPPPTATDIARGPGPTTSPSVTTELTAESARARQLV